MTREETYDLILGATVVAVAYMLWKQHKATTGQAGGPPINVPALPDVQGNDQTGYYIDMNEIFKGVF
jgi:hypothetical protein